MKKFLWMSLVVIVVAIPVILFATQDNESGDKAHWGVAAIRSNGDVDTDGDFVGVDGTFSGDVTADSVSSGTSAVEVEAYSATFTFADNADGTGTLTVSVTDQDGNGVNTLCDVWLSDTDGGGVDSQTADMTLEASDTGTVIQTVAANDHLRVLTDDGDATLTLTNNDTGYACIVIMGKLYTLDFEVTTA
jgi:hypothetical protein